MPAHVVSSCTRDRAEAVDAWCAGCASGEGARGGATKRMHMLPRAILRYLPHIPHSLPICAPPDWTQRPLVPEMLHYARADAHYLLNLAAKMRWAWVHTHAGGGAGVTC